MGYDVITTETYVSVYVYDYYEYESELAGVRSYYAEIRADWPVSAGVAPFETAGLRLGRPLSRAPLSVFDGPR